MQLYDLDLTEEINARAEKLDRRWWKNRLYTRQNVAQADKGGRVVYLDRGDNRTCVRALYEVGG